MIINQPKKWLPPTVVFTALLLLYVTSAGYAIETGRALFADASWFFINILENYGPFHYGTTLRNIATSRIVANFINQLPTIVALRVGTHDVRVLEVIFGASYFGSKILSLLICYKLLDKDSKEYIIFVLFALFAGSINSDVFIISESHVAVSLLWPIVILITRQRGLGRASKYFLYGCIVASTFTYASWALFAPALMLLSIVAATQKSGSERTIRVTTCALLAIPMASNWIAILHPRDTSNEAGFLRGIINAISSVQQGFDAWHAGVIASFAAIILLAVVLASTHAILRRPTVRIALYVFIVAIALLPAVHAVIANAADAYRNSITDRPISNLILQLAILLLYAACMYTGRLDVHRNFRVACALLSLLAVGQVSAQVVATRTWARTMRSVDSTIASATGPIPCSRIDAFAPKDDRSAERSIVCAWWAPSLSILRAPDLRVRTVLVPSGQVYEPFAPLSSSQLPRFRFHAPDYSQYLERVAYGTSLHPGATLTFTRGSAGTLLLRGGFSSPEPWATWTDGDAADMHVCITRFAARGNLHLSFTLAPLLGPLRPSLSVSVVISGTRERIAHWQFVRDERSPVEKALTIYENEWPRNGCGSIRFVMPATLQSPAQMGISRDPRRLGFALLSVSAA